MPKVSFDEFLLPAAEDRIETSQGEVRYQKQVEQLDLSIATLGYRDQLFLVSSITRSTFLATHTSTLEISKQQHSNYRRYSAWSLQLMVEHVFCFAMQRTFHLRKRYFLDVWTLFIRMSEPYRQYADVKKS